MPVPPGRNAICQPAVIAVTGRPFYGIDMHIHLSPRHIHLSPSIHSHCAGVVGTLEDYTEIIAAHLVLIHYEAAKPQHRFGVKAHIAVRGKDLHADVTAETLHAALDMAADKLSRQLRKRKTRLTDKRRTKVARAKENAKRGR
jgi:ribosomal subunit interface protein